MARRSLVDRRNFLKTTVGTTIVGTAGCAGNNENTDQSPTGTQVTSNQTGGSDNDVLNIIWPGGPNNFNPLGWLSFPDFDGARMMYESLTSVDKEAKPIGHLAENWEVNDDASEYTWNIQDDVTWHDGEPLTAEDVAFTFKAVKEHSWPYLGTLSSLLPAPEDLVVPDETTVVTPLTQPNAALPLIMADLFYVMPKHIWSEYEDPTGVKNFENPIGSGPYKFERLKSEQFIEFSVNEEYWGEIPEYSKVIYDIIPSTDSQVLSMEKGTSDMVRLQPGQYVDSLKQTQGIDVIKAPSTFVNYVEFNTRRTPLDDPNLRRALAHTLDRQQIAELVLAGYTEQGQSPIPAGLGFYHNQNIEGYSYNLDKARSMLNNNGYAKENGVRVAPNGEELEFSMSFDNTGNWPRFAEVLKRSFEEVSVKVSLDALEANTYDQKVGVKHDYDLSLGTWRVWFDPSPFLGPVFELDDSTLNVTGYHDDEFDNLMKQQRRTTDLEKRQELLFRCQEILVRDSPWITLFYPNLLFAKRSEAWTNFKPIPRFGMQSPYGHEAGTGPLPMINPK